MRVYLDANVVIGGPTRPEHERLKALAVAGTLTLFASPTTWCEQRSRSITEGSIPLPDDPSAARHAVERSRKLQTDELTEQVWWRPARLHYPRCTFEGMMLPSGVATALLLGDPTGELAQLTDLLEVHALKQTDAMHAMIAHSAKVEWLLTWDEDFIKRASRASWLRPRVETPATLFTCLA